MFFALVAIPFIVFIENFCLAELVKTVFDANIRRLMQFCIIFAISQIDSLAQFHARKMFDEVFVEVSLPDHVKNKILFSLPIIVKTNIIFCTDAMKHI